MGTKPFTPNNDGINDFFPVVIGFDFGELESNRWWHCV